MILFTEEKQTHRQREQSCGCQGGAEWGVLDCQQIGLLTNQLLEFGVSRCILYIEWINKFLSNREYQYLIINHNRKEYKIYICINESLLYTRNLVNQLYFQKKKLNSSKKVTKIALQQSVNFIFLFSNIYYIKILKQTC